MFKLYINEESLREGLRYVIERAEGWDGNGGECQLYGRFDDGGVITELFVRDFAGHNSWIEAEDITQLYNAKWYAWHEGEDLAEWLDGELDDDGDVKSAFIAWLDERGEEYDPHSGEFVILFREFNEDRFMSYMESWRKTWLDVELPDMVDVVAQRVGNYITVSDGVAAASYEWEGSVI